MTQIDLTALDATAQAEMVRSRVIRARQLVEAALQRIDEVEPMVNAFRVVTAGQALSDADGIDSLTDAEIATLPLAGVPVAIKDDTDVAGQPTMWGSAVDRGVSENDAEVVRRLRRAGATIIGKTNVPELTLWPWTASERWGVTRNPWNLDRTPGGSSGGSAAAVCTGMAAMALGSDGGGSIRYPAGLAGLVGVKPQRNRVPVGPEHTSAWHGLLVLGPLTRSVRDAALFLDTVSTPETSPTFRDAIDNPEPRLRIAVSTNPPPGTRVSLSPARRASIEDAADMLAALGHEIIEVDIDYGLASLWNSTVPSSKVPKTTLRPCPTESSSRPEHGQSRASADCSRPGRSDVRSSANDRSLRPSIACSTPPMSSSHHCASRPRPASTRARPEAPCVHSEQPTPPPGSFRGTSPDSPRSPSQRGSMLTTSLPPFTWPDEGAMKPRSSHSLLRSRQLDHFPAGRDHDRQHQNGSLKRPGFRRGSVVCVYACSAEMV